MLMRRAKRGGKPMPAMATSSVTRLRAKYESAVERYPDS